MKKRPVGGKPPSLLAIIVSPSYRTCSNLISKAGDHISRGEGLECKIVVAGVGEPVAVVTDAPLVGEKAVLAQLLQQLVHAAVAKVGDLSDQRTRN